MIYCMYCGAQNSNFASSCKKCRQSFGSKTGVDWSKTNKINTYSPAVHDEPYRIEDEIRSHLPPLNPEPFTQEEIDSIQVANANNCIKIGDMVKEAENLQKKKPSRKRKKS